jgi:hypothetical protein
VLACSSRLRLKSLDCAESVAAFEGKDAIVLVDTSLLAVEQQPSHLGGQYSIMGEVAMDEPGRTAPLVHARLARPIDGLDLALWDQALEIKRQYDARGLPRQAQRPPESPWAVSPHSALWGGVAIARDREHPSTGEQAR